MNKSSLALLVVLAGLAASCATAGPANLAGINPNLTPEQREDIATWNKSMREAGYNPTANLADIDGNGQLDLIYTGPDPLKDPDKDLAAIAETNARTMAGRSYHIDKLVVHAGPDAWIADLKTTVLCAYGNNPKDQCTVEKVWGEEAGLSGGGWPTHPSSDG